MPRKRSTANDPQTLRAALQQPTEHMTLPMGAGFEAALTQTGHKASLSEAGHKS